MTEKVLTYVYCDADWVAIYIDGHIKTQGHSINIWDWLEIVTLGVTKTRRMTCNEDWLVRVGRFPDKLENIVDLEAESWDK